MGKILIVEDDPYVQRFYQHLFELNQYDIILAKNGAEGIELAKRERPSLILLDIMMPELDGLTVLSFLKSDPLTRDITTIMLTNIDDAQVAKKAAGLGADGFLVKSSAPPEKLLDLVKSYLPKDPT